MERKQLITVEQFRALARPTSMHLDQDEVNAYIRECEDSNVIPAIGWERFKAATGQGDWGNSVNADFVPDVFLDGGEYEVEAVCDCQGETKETKYTSGLRKALAYFVYARLLRADGTIVSRAGGMRHSGGFSDHVKDVSGNNQYDDAMDMAQAYLTDALLYLKNCTKQGEVKQPADNRVRIHAIGD